MWQKESMKLPADGQPASTAVTTRTYHHFCRDNNSARREKKRSWNKWLMSGWYRHRFGTVSLSIYSTQYVGNNERRVWTIDRNYSFAGPLSANVHILIFRVVIHCRSVGSKYEAAETSLAWLRWFLSIIHINSLHYTSLHYTILD